MKDNSNLCFTPDLTDEEVEAALADEAWLENVTEAALFGAINCYQKNKTSHDIMQDIIIYNVNRRVCELFFKKEIAIPKIIKWESSLSALNAYESFESLAIKFAIEKKLNKFKKTNVTIQINNSLVQKELQDWCERLKNEYLLDIHYKKNKNNIYKITFE